MWVVRVLVGPQKGQTFELKEGRNLIGRASHCGIVLNSPGISKEHSEIHVQTDKILIMDLRSSNGTFLNGVKIQNGVIKPADKVSVHDVIFDIVQQVKRKNTAVAIHPHPLPYSQPHSQSVIQNQSPFSSVVTPPSLENSHEAQAQESQKFNPDQGLFVNLGNQISSYIDQIILPGVYKLAEYFDFKMILMTFVIIFIFITTMLSLFPMMNISRTSILLESKRRAESLARSLEKLNKTAISQGSITSLGTYGIEAEDGVKSVLIIQQSDGLILAPTGRAGTTPDLPFVHRARREMTKQIEEIDYNTVGVSFPIGAYDPNIGELSVKAHAIVIYDVGSLALDNGQVISLFMQTLILATVIGLIIFFIMYKLVERPFVLLNTQLDAALRENRDNTEVPFQFPALQALISNINSLLSRYISGNPEKNIGGAGHTKNKDAEATRLAQMIPNPVIMISTDERIIFINSSFAQLTNISPEQILDKNIDSIYDIALQKNISTLVSLCAQAPESTQSDNLEFMGNPSQLTCQAFLNDAGVISYYMIIITPPHPPYPHPQGGN